MSAVRPSSTVLPGHRPRRDEHQERRGRRSGTAALVGEPGDRGRARARRSGSTTWPRPAGGPSRRADCRGTRSPASGSARPGPWTCRAGMLLEPPNLPGWNQLADPRPARPRSSTSRRSSRTTPTPPPTANTGPAPGGTPAASSCSPWARESAAGSSRKAGSSRAGTATAASAGTSSSRWRTPASARAAATAISRPTPRPRRW